MKPRSSRSVRVLFASAFRRPSPTRLAGSAEGGFLPGSGLWGFVSAVTVGKGTRRGLFNTIPGAL